MARTIDLSEPTRRRSWWPSFLMWTGAVVLYAIVLSQQIGLPLSISLQSSAAYLYSLALLMIPVRRWTEREMAAARRSTAVRVASHLGVGLVTIAAWFGLNMLYARVSVGPAFWQVVYAGSWLFQLMFAVTIYGMVLGVTLAIQSWRREQERERHEAALALVARDAELSAVRAHFQPHFVLNTLNSLLALIDQDPAMARTMVVRLADIMKAVFDRGDLPAVPLSRELDLVQAYLDVERIRFGDRLTVDVNADAAARAVAVPPFLLQPIVENAIKHGIAPYAHPGRVTITARTSGDDLHIDVQDTGSGSGMPIEGTGRGLQLTRRRLETLYGGKYVLTMDRTAAGTCAHIVVPREMEPAHVS